jgi:4-methylaminobutanoate oxidase (formaldehyde-forming)
MLNARGGIECDFTVTRVEEELFSIVTGTAFGNHDAAWIRSHLPSDGSVRVSDVTARWACFALWGPRAPHPGTLTTDELTFGYMSMRDIAVGDAGPRAAGDVRRHCGALYRPTEYGAAVVDAVDAGSRTASSLAATRRSTRCLAAPPRVGGRHHARRDAVRGDSGSASISTR